MKCISPATKEVRTWTTDSRRWSAYRPRPGDVVIATPAKTGTTWMQQIVSLLIFQSPAPRVLGDDSPWLDMRVRPLDEIVARLEAQRHRRYIKSHLPFDALPVYDAVRYIHVGRDGRDVFMSWYNHATSYTRGFLEMVDAAGLADDTLARPHPRLPQDIHAFFAEWIARDNATALRDDFPAARFFDIEKSFWAARHAPNVLNVHYADLKADLDGEMRRISAFLDIPIAEGVWPSLVEAATFAAMKTNGPAILPHAGRAFTGGHERFLFSGENARWRDVLRAAEIAEYEAQVRDGLPPGLARWLERGRLATGVDPRTAPD